MKPADVARVCYESCRAYAVALGDYSQESWDYALPEARGAMLKRVLEVLKHPVETVAELPVQERLFLAIVGVLR